MCVRMCGSVRVCVCVVVCVRTGQSAVDLVVFGPEPDHGILRGLDLVQGLGGHLLKVTATLLTAEERPDVAPHGVQDGRGITL